MWGKTILQDYLLCYQAGCWGVEELADFFDYENDFGVVGDKTNYMYGKSLQ